MCPIWPWWIFNNFKQNSSEDVREKQVLSHIYRKRRPLGEDIFVLVDEMWIWRDEDVGMVCDCLSRIAVKVIEEKIC
jgi:hypothetical protein